MKLNSRFKIPVCLVPSPCGQCVLGHVVRASSSPRLGYIGREGLGRRRTGTRQDSSARDVFEDETDICIERENARRLGEMACKGRHG